MMLRFKLVERREAIVGTVIVGAVISALSFGIVQAEHAVPAGGVKYTCSSGAGCVQGDATNSTGNTVG